MIKNKATIALTILAVVFAVGCSEKTSSKPEVKRKSGELSLPIPIAEKPAPIPKFAEITFIPEKKKKFFTYLQHKIAITNDYVWAEREFVIRLREKAKNGSLNAKEQAQFYQLVERYGLEPGSIQNDEDFDTLLARVDVVPASLVLAQGANESAWGTSRFATEGRNFFGIWCYREGCGIKPSRRNAGSTHEVRKFKTVQDGVNFYVHNINIGHAYDSLRAIRAELRSSSEKLSGVKLATGLSRYSERGETYVEEIQRMIEQNELSAYNKVRAP